MSIVRHEMVPGPIEADWLKPIPDEVEVRRRRRLAPGFTIVVLLFRRAVSSLDNLAATPLLPYEPERRVLPFGQWEWHLEAACRDMDPAIFFGSEVTKGPMADPKEIQRARAICRDCPVQVACLTHALTEPELAGVWAGTSGQQRAKWLRKIRDGELTVQKVVDTWLTK